MFDAVPARPDLVSQEHDILAFWRERGIFARLRAKNAGGPNVVLSRRPDHREQPDGGPPRLGRAYKDLYQRFHAMLGEDQR